MQSKIPTISKTSLSEINQLIEDSNVLDMASPKNAQKCPSTLLSLVQKHLCANEVAPSAGILPLRKIISKKYSEGYGYAYCEETEVTISASTTQAAFTAISSMVKDGDEVIIIEPTETLYAPAVILNGAKAISIRCKAPEFVVDWEEVKMLISSKTKMIIFSSPNNPTGILWTEEDMFQLQKITNGTNIVVLSNEALGDIVFDEYVHYSAACFENLRKRSFVISSFSSTLGLSDWGVAFCVAPENLMREYRKMQQMQMLTINTPMQYAISEYLSAGYDFSSLSIKYQGKRNYFNRLLSRSLFKTIPSQGGYYQFIDYSLVSEEKDIEFATRLIKDFNIATIPASVFYHEKIKDRHLRICLAKTNEELEDAAKILLSIPSTVAEL